MIDEYLISAFISKIVSDRIDCTKRAIKKALKQKNKKSNTLHVQMYNVIVETIKNIAVSHCKYDKKKIYDASAEFLKLAKNEQGDIIYKIKKSLTVLGISHDMDDCERFQDLLLEKLTYDENRQLYRAIILIRNYEKSLKTETSKANNDNLCNKQQNKFQNNKKEIYFDIWNQSLFLQHKDPERMVRLCDAFVAPNYQVHQHKITYNEDDNLESFIDKFINYQSVSTMLITGVPGIGKSSIVSWIANKYRKDDKVIILRFRDWEQEDLSRSILNAIKITLGCNKKDLNHKTLILDGFDEIKALENREKLLYDFLNVVFDIDCFKCIITSRPHYIKTKNFDNYIELAPFDPQKVGEFYENIKGVKLNETISEDNIGVYGIPVILYMSIMCDLDITKQSTKPEIYNRVFAETGGIFDRFYFDEKAYSDGAHILRNANNIEKYLAFLRGISYKMFESNDDSSLILHKNDIPKLEFGQEKISILEFPLKPLFESIEKVEFIHNSIYEYFLSEYIYLCISNAINGAKEELADVLGTILKNNFLFQEILEFLQYRIRNGELNKKFENVCDTFNMMLQDGMTYYVSEPCKSVIVCERCIFYNMLELLHLWEVDNMKLDGKIRNYLFFRNTKKMNLAKTNLIGIVLSSGSLNAANLSVANLSSANLLKADLSEADLRGAKLRGTFLWRANLSEADLSEADLLRADLSEANLRNADLSEANLRGTKLRGANLRGADLSESDLSETDLRGVNLRGVDFKQCNIDLAIFDESQIKYLKGKYFLQKINVYVASTDEIISYEEYCKRRN